MRKLLCFFSLIICTLCLCGCESNQEDRTKIFTALKNEKIISDSMILKHIVFGVLNGVQKASIIFTKIKIQK